jgi:glycine cleavage system H protein
MDPYTYVNIFETKGIEYLVIIAFLLLLIPFWILLNKKVRPVKVLKAIANLPSQVLRIPYGYFHTENLTWAHLEKSGAARVGLDDLLLQLTGNVGIKYLKEAEEEVRKGDPIIQVIQNGKHLDIKAPVSGQLLGTNPLLADSPELLNNDPYGEGWICRIKPSDWKAETGSYFLADEAVQWLKGEMQKVRDFIAMRAEKYAPGFGPAILQDGGELHSNLLSEMPDEIWSDFQKEFLD